MDRRCFLASPLLAALPAGAADLGALIVAARPSVLAVGSYDPLASPRFGFRGTGFLVGDGSLVATCWHVLTGALGEAGKLPERIAVQATLADGSNVLHEATLGPTDPVHDLALLKLRQPLGPGLALAPAETVHEGQEVALIGFPIGGVLGFRHVTHRGIVASIVVSSLPTGSARQLNAANVARLRQGSFELLQLDATAYPGNSGGPLLDQASGRVVGVVNMVMIKGNRESALSQPTGITYAVPVRYLAALLGGEAPASK